MSKRPFLNADGRPVIGDDGKPIICEDCPCTDDCVNACGGDTPSEWSVALHDDGSGTWANMGAGCTAATCTQMNNTFILTQASSNPGDFASIAAQVALLGTDPSSNKGCVYVDPNCLECVWFYKFPPPTTCNGGAGAYWRFIVLTICRQSNFEMPCTTMTTLWQVRIHIVSDNFTNMANGSRIVWSKNYTSPVCGNLSGESIPLVNNVNFGNNCRYNFGSFLAATLSAL
jgi:hypothetical protein